MYYSFYYHYFSLFVPEHLIWSRSACVNRWWWCVGHAVVCVNSYHIPVWFNTNVSPWEERVVHRRNRGASAQEASGGSFTKHPTKTNNVSTTSEVEKGGWWSDLGLWWWKLFKVVRRLRELVGIVQRGRKVHGGNGKYL